MAIIKHRNSSGTVRDSPLLQRGAELTIRRLIDFFKFYSRDFTYNTGVISIRAGLLSKESKGWDNDVCPLNPITAIADSVPSPIKGQRGRGIAYV